MSQNSATNLYQNLSQIIADYNGYEELHNRQKTDRKLRTFFIEKINKIVDSLKTVPKPSVEEDQLRLQELTNTTRRMLTTICQSLSDPTYAGSSFFTSSNIVVKRLEKIYQFENTMMHEVSAIAEEMETLKKNELNKSIIEDHFLHIKDFIDNFNQALFERESLILGDDGV